MKLTSNCISRPNWHCELFHGFIGFWLPTTCNMIFSKRNELYILLSNYAYSQNLPFLKVPPNYLFSIKHIIRVME